MDQLSDSIYRTVHDFRDGKGGKGAVALAPLVNMSQGTLNNKAAPSMEKHHLTLLESVAIQRTANDYRILHSYNAILGFASFQLGSFEGIADIEILEAYTKVHKELGDTANALHKSFADRRITQKELLNIKREGMETIQAIFELMHRVEAIADEK